MDAFDPFLSCYGKHVYQSYAQAERILKQRAPQKRQAKRRVEVYRCPCCGRHHIGSSFKRRGPLPVRGETEDTMETYGLD